MSIRHDLRALRGVMRMLDLPRALLIQAVALGSLTLSASVALAGTSAWLIVRAAQMPPVMFLNVAAVGVRTFGVLRGVSRYLDRLAGHDVALRGVENLRTTLYERLASGRTEELARLRRGDLLARTGADVDDVGDVVVKALIPAAVAAVVSLGSVIALAFLFWPSAIVLALCLAVSAFVVPALAARADARAEQARVQARTAIAEATETLVSRAAELALSGTRPAAMADLDRAQREAQQAERIAAGPLAASAGLAVLTTGAAALISLLVAAPAALAGNLSATALGVVVLLPLAVFEATAPLPAAVSQLRRSAAAARRIRALVEATGPDEVGLEADLATASPPRGAGDLVLEDLVAAWPGGTELNAPLTVRLAPGGSLAVVGPSGTGKTTLLLTLAGMLPPRSGRVRIDGIDPHTLRGPERAAHVAFTAEDAHIFSTSVLENLRVARGDLTQAEAEELLDAVGLGEWVASLPEGLATAITGETISGGERRRLLIARALASPAPLLLLDEPAEHLPDAVAQELVRDLLGLSARGRSVVVVTHHVAAIESADAVIALEDAKISP